MKNKTKIKKISFTTEDNPIGYIHFSKKEQTMYLFILPNTQEVAMNLMHNNEAYMHSLINYVKKNEKSAANEKSNGKEK